MTDTKATTAAAAKAAAEAWKVGDTACVLNIDDTWAEGKVTKVETSINDGKPVYTVTVTMKDGGVVVKAGLREGDLREPVKAKEPEKKDLK